MAESTGLFNNLRFKITLYILIGAIVFSGVIIAVTSSFLGDTLQKSLEEQGRIIAGSIAELAAEKLIEEDVVGLKKILEKYRYYLSNEYILIVDADYAVVSDTYNGQLPAELSSGPETNAIYENYDFSSGEVYSVTPNKVQEREVYDITYPIKDGLLGFVRVGLRKSFIDEQINRTLLLIGAVIAIGTLIIILVALAVITVQVTRPVIKLTEAANEISMGNFNAPIEVKAKNELQVLAVAIDRMKESLKTSLTRLKTKSTIGRF
ncbi:MAG: HAMP domain-containing protein [Calditrichia bacterium]